MEGLHHSYTVPYAALAAAVLPSLKPLNPAWQCALKHIRSHLEAHTLTPRSTYAHISHDGDRSSMMGIVIEIDALERGWVPNVLTPTALPQTPCVCAATVLLLLTPAAA